MMDKSLDIKLHFECTVPVFKCEHGTPVKPEIRIKYFFIEEIFNLFIVQIFILCEEQLHNLHAALLAQTEFAVCMCILSAMLCRTT